jgi:uncharacterized RDD family membrane protein YckC
MEKIIDEKYNTFWLRLFARFVDSVLIYFPYFIIVLLFKNTITNNIDFFLKNDIINSDNANFLLKNGIINNSKIILFISILFPFIDIVYNILSNKYFGKTIGKKIFGLKVLHLSEKRLLNFKEAILRNSYHIIDFLISFFMVFSTIMVISDMDIKQPMSFESNFYSQNKDIHIVKKVMNVIGFIWLAMNIIAILIDGKRRALHDMIANSVVIKDEQYNFADNEDDL